MNTNEKIKLIKNIIKNLPHAFDYPYWNMADTTYKEELFLSFILVTNTPKEEALIIQSKVLPKNRLIRQILKEEVIECMGCYGKNHIGTSFYGTYTNAYESKLKEKLK